MPNIVYERDGKRYVLLADWAKQHGLDLVNTKGLARLGRLRRYTKLIRFSPRLVIEEDAPVGKATS